MKDSPLEDWYKESAAQLPGEVPSGAWQTIASHLEVVAAEKSAVLNIRFAVLSLFGIISSIVLFMGSLSLDSQSYVGNSYKLLPSTSSELIAFIPQESESNKVVGVQEVQSETSPQDYNQGHVDPIEIDLYPTNGVSNPVGVISNSLPLIVEPVEQLDIVDELAIDLNPMTVLSANEIPITLASISNTKRPFDTPEEKSKKRIYIGLGGSVNNLWVLNQKTFSGFDRTSLVANSLKFGADYSLIGGVQLCTNSSIQTELILHKSAGQSYSVYTEGQLVSTQTHLDYTRLNILYKQSFGSFLDRREMSGSLNYLVGPYVGYLRKAHTESGTHTESTLDNYTRLDAGLDLGLQYDYPLNDRLNLSGGLRTSVGFKNVFSGTDKIPTDFNQTRNLSVGLNVTLSYYLRS